MSIRKLLIVLNDRSGDYHRDAFYAKLTLEADKEVSFIDSIKFKVGFKNSLSPKNRLKLLSADEIFRFALTFTLKCYLRPVPLPISKCFCKVLK